jgi:hypothetical protein
LKLLNSKKVEYLLVGGYAVSYHGHPRATADMDVWVDISPKNAAKIVSALRDFGFAVEELASELFLESDKIVRLGEPPLRIEILTTLSGVEFAPCFARRERPVLSGLKVNVISLQDLRRNKAASGRPKDLNDLEQLPEE